MTTPVPSTEERVSALEVQAAQLRERHTLLEAQMVQGLADLQRALDAINERRPPVRRRLEELEQRVDAVAPPNGTEEESAP